MAAVSFQNHSSVASQQPTMEPFLYSPAMCIAAMPIINIELNILGQISHNKMPIIAANCLKIIQYTNIGSKY